MHFINNVWLVLFVTLHFGASGRAMERFLLVLRHNKHKMLNKTSTSRLMHYLHRFVFLKAFRWHQVQPSLIVSEKRLKTAAGVSKENNSDGTT